VVGLVFVVRIPHGLPYDEPSYWNVTGFYARWHRMPVLGHPGVTYEAQHPPLAFVFAALGHGIGSIFGAASSYSFTRIVGGLELLASVVVLDRILRRTVRSLTGRAVAIVLYAVTPMMVAMSWSVQNDSLSLLIGLVALEAMLVAEQRDGPGLRVRSAALVGVVVGLGILTKITVVFLVPAFAIWVAARAWSRWRRVLEAWAAFGAGVAVACGWWFVRNLVVYGHLVGSTSIGGGPSWPGAGWHGSTTVSSMGKELVTYLWVPTEYYRNLVHASGALQALLAALTAGVVVVAVVLRVRAAHGELRIVPPAQMTARGSAWLLLVITAVVTLGGYELLFTEVIAFPPRTAFIALPLWSSAIGYVVDRLVAGRPAPVHRSVVAMTVVFALALDLWVLTSVGSLGAIAHTWS